MRVVRGTVMVKKPVPCAQCRTTIWRTTHFKTARCEDCKKLRDRSKSYRLMKLLRTHARRYRIILHVLGWEDEQFEEMLQEMKRSPMCFRKRAETRDASFDLTVERHPSRFRGAIHPHRRWTA